ncbi:DUF7118 family protein [Haloarcula litorea]|uniref:DUF7118 family protein n=1 Tax=Haloarcula litorea TaxID=3032579 RepID=UPI0023E8E10F|nr:hypothetical protein [Halomicroarcula sp. GDY20]
MADAARDLRTAADDLERARERVETVGETQLRRCREAYRELLDLLDRYEGRATGSGDFKAFTEFQGAVATLAEDLDEDLPERETFEAVDDYLQQRRLSEADFETARRKLEPVGDLVGRLDEWERAREDYADARRAARRRLDELDERVAELERLRRLGDADLDAPVDRLREPVGAYDDAVREAFREFRSDAPARELLALVERTEAFPLVEFTPPPDDLLAYVRDHEAGTEPVPTLLEYADYSASKLAHYVDDAAALQRAVATRRTYLRNLDAEPLTVGWPPPPADHLPWLAREYRRVVASFADETVVARLRDVRALADREDYERLRESAVARAELTDEEHERLASGAVERDLRAAREERSAIEDALAAHDPL